MGSTREYYRGKRQRDAKRRLEEIRRGRELLDRDKPPVDTEGASERWRNLRMEIPDADTNQEDA